LIKKFLLATMAFLLTLSFTSSAIAGNNYCLANAKVFINEKQLIFDQEPIITNGRILVPVRAIAESLGATVEWQDPKVIIKQGVTEIILTINSEMAQRENRKIFFMEQPPIIVNGRTMVSLRFVAEALGASVAWDDNTRAVAITSNGDFTPSKQPIDEGAGDNYYKLYDPIIGPDTGPIPEEAKKYVLEHRLLKDIKNIQYVPTRFLEFGSYDTMISGTDESGQEKLVWLTKDRYTGEISVTGSVFPNKGISQETVISTLEKKEIKKESIKKIYIAPYEKNQIYWFVIAEQGNKKYYYCLDFYTGDIIIENIAT
jgi:uncharacterized protein YpmB